MIVGLLITAHGAQKLFGWFAGHGLRGTADFLESLGWRPGRAFAVPLGTAELAGGLALAVGPGAPVAAGLLIAVLANAAWVVHRPNGLWNTAGGYEYPLVLSGAALAVALTGPGRFSIDHLAGWRPEATTAALIALSVGLLGWLAGNLTRDIATTGLLRRWTRHLRPGT